MSDDVYRSVRMSPWEVDSLLRQMDTSARRDGADGSPRRAHARIEFRVNDVLIAVKHPGQSSVSKYLVTTRNLSAGGMSFMYGGFLHTGTLCSIVLTDVKGEAVKLLGVVRSCRHVAKSLHEIGVQFTQKVDPSRFVRGEARMTSNDPGMLDSRLPDLTGCALFVSEIECERSAAKARLSATGLEVELAESVEGAIGRLGERSFDLVLLDSALGESNAEDAGVRLREAGFLGSLVCIAEEQDAKGLASCNAISAVVSVASPVSVMMDVIRAVLEEASNPASAGGVYSIFAKDRTRRSMIERFVSSATGAAKDIGEALKAKRHERLKEICAMLKRGGWENGFPAFGDAARRVVGVIDAEGPENEAAIRAEVDRLAGLCARLRTGSEEETKADDRAKQGDRGEATKKDAEEAKGDADAGETRQAA